MWKSSTSKITSITPVVILEPPGAPTTIKSLPFLCDDGWSHGTKPGACRARSPLAVAAHHAEHIRSTRLGDKIIHLVIQQKPETRYRDAIAVGVVQRVSHGDGIALFVDHIVLSGLVAFMPGDAGVQSFRQAGAQLLRLASRA